MAVDGGGATEGQEVGSTDRESVAAGEYLNVFRQL
jgi:hypothetical protein